MKKSILLFPVVLTTVCLTSCKEEEKTVIVSAITATCNKMVYKVGDVINKEDIKVKLINSDKTSKDTTDFTISDVTFPYTFSATDEVNGKKEFNITASDCSTSIVFGVTKDKFVSSIVATSNKMIYKVGETLNKSDIKVKAIYSDKTEVELNDFTIEGTTMPYTFTSDDQSSGKKEIKIKANDCTTTITFGVVQKDHTLTSISASLKEGTNYFVAETSQINKEDIIVTATYDDGWKRDVTNWTCDDQFPYKFTKDDGTIRKKKFGITFNEGLQQALTTQLIVPVLDATIKSISAELISSKKEFEPDLSITKDDIKITATFDVEGILESKITLKSTDWECTDFKNNSYTFVDADVTSGKTFNISYTNNSTTVNTTLNVTVNAESLVSLSASLIESKKDTIVCAGDVIKKTDLEVKATYSNNRVKTVSDWTSDLFPNDSTSYLIVENDVQTDRSFLITYTDGLIKKTYPISFTYGYQITLDVGFGEDYDPIRIKKGEQIPTLKDPVNGNHQFTGWFKNSACTEKYTFSSPIKENTTIYAGWSFDGSTNEKEYAKMMMYFDESNPSRRFSMTGTLYISGQDPIEFSHLNVLGTLGQGDYLDAKTTPPTKYEGREYKDEFGYYKCSLDSNYNGEYYYDSYETKSNRSPFIGTCFVDHVLLYKDKWDKLVYDSASETYSFTDSQLQDVTFKLGIYGNKVLFDEVETEMPDPGVTGTIFFKLKYDNIPYYPPLPKPNGIYSTTFRQVDNNGVLVTDIFSTIPAYTYLNVEIDMSKAEGFTAGQQCYFTSTKNVTEELGAEFIEGSGNYVTIYQNQKLLSKGKDYIVVANPDETVNASIVQFNENVIQPEDKLVFKYNSLSSLYSSYSNLAFSLSYEIK